MVSGEEITDVLYPQGRVARRYRGESSGGDVEPRIMIIFIGFLIGGLIFLIYQICSLMSEAAHFEEWVERWKP